MTDVLLCVGNTTMGDDGASPLLPEMCAERGCGKWTVIDGGSAPENDIVAIRELRPARLQKLQYRRAVQRPQKIQQQHHLARAGRHRARKLKRRRTAHAVFRKLYLARAARRAPPRDL